MKPLYVRPIQFAGVLCAVAVPFYCAYTRSYEAVSVAILLVFFAYFLNLKSGGRGNSVGIRFATGMWQRYRGAFVPRFREASRSHASDSPSPGECTTHERPGQTENTRSPSRELAKGLACLVAGGLGVVIGSRFPDVQLGVALALTAVVVGIVAFMLFLLRAASAWQSRKAS